jgi:REP element-mobilizing transposase RayT
MSHTFAKNHLHVVFSTKERRKTIAKELQPELWSYMAGICHNLDIASIAIGGTDDHTHILLHLPPTISLSKAIQMLKANASRWMNHRQKDFSWQQGFGAFSVGISNTAAVVRYIQNQEAHHRKMTFEEEYLRFLKRHGINYDPKFVFG